MPRSRRGGGARDIARAGRAAAARGRAGHPFTGLAALGGTGGPIAHSARGVARGVLGGRCAPRAGGGAAAPGWGRLVDAPPAGRGRDGQDGGGVAQILRRLPHRRLCDRALGTTVGGIAAGADATHGTVGGIAASCSADRPARDVDARGLQGGKPLLATRRQLGQRQRRRRRAGASGADGAGGLSVDGRGVRDGRRGVPLDARRAARRCAERPPSIRAPGGTRPCCARRR